MVTGDALVCVDRGSVHIGVCRASRRLTVGTVGAAVGGFAVEPDQPSAVDLGNLGDLATCHRRGGTLSKGGNSAVRERIFGSRIAVNGHLQGFGQGAAVRRSINQLRGKIRIRLHIYTQHSSGSFAVFIVQQAFCVFNRCAVVVQQGHTVRQNQIERAAVGGVLHLRHNGNNGIVCAVQQGRGHGKTVIVQCSGGQIAVAGFFQLAFGPLANADFGFTGGNRQTLAADIGTNGCVGEVGVQFRADNGSRDFFFSGLLFCRFRGSFGYILAGVGAALVGLAVVCFRRLGLLLHLHGFLGGLRCGFLRKRRTGQHGAEHYRRRKQRGNAMLQFVMCFFHCEILSKQRFFHEKKRLQNADAAVIFRGYPERAGLWLFQIFALGLQNRPIGRYALVGQRSNRNGQVHGDPYL